MRLENHQGRAQVVVRELAQHGRRLRGHPRLPQVVPICLLEEQGQRHSSQVRTSHSFFMNQPLILKNLLKIS